MARILHPIVSFTVRKFDRMLLALSWILGLGFGGIVFRFAGSVNFSQMPLAAKSQPSIFGLLAVSFLPFLFSAFAVLISAPRLLYGICFCKAMLFGYISRDVFTAFGGGSWLVRWMLMFTDLWSVVLLYHYCLRHISGTRRFSHGVLAVYLVIAFCIAWVDFICISPLLRQLLS